MHATIIMDAFFGEVIVGKVNIEVLAMALHLTLTNSKELILKSLLMEYHS